MDGIRLEEVELRKTCLTVPGAACERAGTPALLDFIAGFPCFEVRRTDLALDVFDSEAPKPEALEKLFLNHRKHVCTRFRTCEFRRNENGQTVAFGNRRREAYLRVYTACEADLRIELEAKGDLANEIAEALLEAHRNGDPVEPLAVGFIRRAVDFRAPGADRNPARASLAPWWKRATAHAVAPRPRGREPPRSPEDALAWFARQCAGTVKGLRALGYGPQIEAAIDAAAVPLWLRQWIPAEKLKYLIRYPEPSPRKDRRR